MSRGSACPADVLRLDPDKEVRRIADTLRAQVFGRLRRKGAVLGLSGGIDSSVACALGVQALGADRVLGLLMPEHDSSSDSERLGRLVAAHLGVEVVREDIGPILEAAGCYRRRDEAVRSVVADYEPHDRFKIVLPSIQADSAYRLFHVVVQLRDGRHVKARLPLAAYQTIVAATNFKQRVRKMMEYYHADRLRYAVLGTPNRLEYDQGFFVKNGDGSADVKPIAHLYKTQVYQLAEYLGIPEEIRSRPPTTDTYSLEQSQEEFFFSVPYAQLDLCLYARERALSPTAVAPAVSMTPEQVMQVYRDIDAKRAAAIYLNEPPLLVPDAEESCPR